MKEKGEAMQNNYRNVSRSVVSQARSAVVRDDVLLTVKEKFPIEVTMLLDVLSRIESRRQAKLFIAGKDVC